MSSHDTHSAMPQHVQAMAILDGISLGKSADGVWSSWNLLVELFFPFSFLQQTPVFGIIATTGIAPPAQNS